MCVCLLLGFISGFTLCPQRYGIQRNYISRKSMKEDADVSPAVTMPLDSEAVDYVLSRISTLLGPSQQSEGVQVGEKDISGLFDKIFNDIKGESDLSSQTRELMALELNVAYASVKGTWNLS